MLIRNARAGERGSLIELERHASLHWGAYREQLAAHPDAVELPREQIDHGLVRVAELGGEVVGLAVLLPPVSGACELDGLFVAPGRMGAGVGRALVEDALARAREHGAAEVGVSPPPRRPASTSVSASAATSRCGPASAPLGACESRYSRAPQSGVAGPNAPKLTPPPWRPGTRRGGGSRAAGSHPRRGPLGARSRIW